MTKAVICNDYFQSPFILLARFNYLKEPPIREGKRDYTITCKNALDIVFVTIKYAKPGMNYLMRSTPLYKWNYSWSQTAEKASKIRQFICSCECCGFIDV